MSSFIFSVLPTTMLIVLSAVLIFELDVFLEIIELVHALSIANLTGLPSTRPFILMSQSWFIVDRAVSWRLAPVELAPADSALFLPPPLPSVPPLDAPTRPSSGVLYLHPLP
ncbi:hypothetical protein BpHYR1_052349 [Brachionus plicatilis]|uniref:Uncharacterized protein n=1 Tax=Brachionus plicatilis TaxID=10195 RepID=A0A3M7SB99_BRAPC|nr:hypothetical protein BpHYR1_052349 [Brachionus plicatilis]